MSRSPWAGTQARSNCPYYDYSRGTVWQRSASTVVYCEVEQPPAVRTATYRVAVGLKTAGIRC
jgi:hypothetical protein